MYVNALGENVRFHTPRSTLHTNFNITASAYFVGGVSMETSAALIHMILHMVNPSIMKKMPVCMYVHALAEKMTGTIINNTLHNTSQVEHYSFRLYFVGGYPRTPQLSRCFHMLNKPVNPKKKPVCTLRTRFGGEMTRNYTPHYIPT